MNNRHIKWTFLLSVIIVSIFITFIILSSDQESKQSIYAISPILESSEQFSFQEIFDREIKFNFSDRQNLLVLLHIQKTGGTSFEKHLVQDLKTPNPCSCSDKRRRCSCNFNNQSNIDSLEPASHMIRKTWLLSRFSTGWICGIHADWTQLTNCISSLTRGRRIFFMTFIREPIDRFISEYRHVKRGATWKNSRKHCDNYDTQICFNDKPDWQNVTLQEFMNCSQNMAINRQTRMLANHNLVKCSLDGENDDELLASAKDNLKNMAYFGICEQQLKSQRIFEHTFRLTFRHNFSQSTGSKSEAFVQELSYTVLDEISKLNHLDVQLYNYAIQLFSERAKKLQI